MTDPLAIDSPIPVEWKVHTPRLLSEIMTNNHMGILKIPMNIFGRMLAALAERAMVLGDVPLDHLMIRLALYSQGDPSDPSFDLDGAVAINESRVRDQHTSTAEAPTDFEKADLDLAIERAREDDHKWERATRMHDWRNHVGSATQRQWSGIPFAARVAIALDAEEAASAEDWDHLG